MLYSVYAVCIIAWYRLQIWLSADGGYTFHCLLAVPDGENVVDFDFSDHSLAVLTSTGRVFYGKVNSRQIEELDAVLLPTNTTKLVFDSSGDLGAYTFYSQVCSEMPYIAPCSIALLNVPRLPPRGS